MDDFDCIKRINVRKSNSTDEVSACAKGCARRDCCLYGTTVLTRNMVITGCDEYTTIQLMPRVSREIRI